MARTDECPRYFTVRALRGDRLAEVQLCGELDICGLTSLYSAVGEVLSCRHSGAPSTVVLDISQLTFVDVRGMRAIADVRSLLMAEGCKVCISSGPAADRVAGLLGTTLR